MTSKLALLIGLIGIATTACDGDVRVSRGDAAENPFDLGNDGYDDSEDYEDYEDSEEDYGYDGYDETTFAATGTLAGTIASAHEFYIDDADVYGYTDAEFSWVTIESLGAATPVMVAFELPSDLTSLNAGQTIATSYAVACSGEYYEDEVGVDQVDVVDVDHEQPGVVTFSLRLRTAENEQVETTFAIPVDN